MRHHGRMPSAHRRHELLDELIEELRAEGRDVEPGTLFRRPAIRTRGAAVAFLGAGDRLLVKLPEARIAELIEQGRVDEVTMGMRTLREWAVVPCESDDATETAAVLPLLLESLDFVRPDGGR